VQRCGSRSVNTLYNPTGGAREVEIIHPAHPLRGQRLPVRRRYQEGGESYVMVEWPGGQVRRIPLSWTELGAEIGSTPGAKFSPSQLRAIRAQLDQLTQVKNETGDGVVSGEATIASGGDDHEPRTRCNSQATVDLDQAEPSAAAEVADPDRRLADQIPASPVKGTAPAAHPSRRRQP